MTYFQYVELNRFLVGTSFGLRKSYRVLRENDLLFYVELNVLCYVDLVGTSFGLRKSYRVLRENDLFEKVFLSFEKNDSVLIF